jgi:hypothetical protein
MPEILGKEDYDGILGNYQVLRKEALSIESPNPE